MSRRSVGFRREDNSSGWIRRRGAPRRQAILAGGATVAVCFLSALLGSTAALAASDTAAGERAHFDGMTLPEAWQKLHQPGDGPLVSVHSEPGDGPSGLSVVQRLDPSAASQLSPSQREELAATRIGSTATLQVLTGVAVPRPGVEGEASASPAADQSELSCGGGDPYNCDYFFVSFTQNNKVNETEVDVYYHFEGYRTNGTTVRPRFLTEKSSFTGTDKPCAFECVEHDWSSSIEPAGGPASYYDSACQCMITWLKNHGSGSWFWVDGDMSCVCIPIPGGMAHVNSEDELDARGCWYIRREMGGQQYDDFHVGLRQMGLSEPDTGVSEGDMDCYTDWDQWPLSTCLPKALPCQW